MTKIFAFQKKIFLLLLFFITNSISGQEDILVILAHPNLGESEVNKHFASKLSELDRVLIHDLYAHYEDFNIDVDREQKLIEDFDYIILQFPLYWFSSPALLKKWQDEVFTSAFALDDNSILHQKKLMLVVSTGGTAKDFTSEGIMQTSMEEVLIPFKSFAHLTGMTFLTPFITYAVPNPRILNIPMTELQKEERKLLIEEEAKRLIRTINTLD